MNYLIHLHFYEIMKINACDLTRGIPLKMMEKLIYLKTLLLKLGPI